MKKNDLTSLAVRFMGVYILVSAVPGASVFFVPSAVQSNPLMVLPPLLLIVIAVLFIIYNRRIGSLIVSGIDTGDDIPSAMTVADWQAVLFSAIGVSTVSRGFWSLTNSLLSRVNHFQTPTVVTSLVMIAVGVVLFFQSRGLANLWKRFQESRDMRSD